jgi:E3 ubiquitin-protein ligase DOA10
MSYSELNESCIICLSEEPAVIKYDAPCECKPYIHGDCLAEWFVINPNICPICKKNYEGATMQIMNRTYVLSSCSNVSLIILMIILFSLFIYLEYFLR